jgi:hypothetical protein
VYSYGKEEDDAARTGAGSPDLTLASIGDAGSRFTYTFPAYSATVIVLSPLATP